MKTTMPVFYFASLGHRARTGGGSAGCPCFTAAFRLGARWHAWTIVGLGWEGPKFVVHIRRPGERA